MIWASVLEGFPLQSRPAQQLQAGVVESLSGPQLYGFDQAGSRKCVPRALWQGLYQTLP